MSKSINIDEQFVIIVQQVKNVAEMLWNKGWSEANAGFQPPILRVNYHVSLSCD